MHMHVSGIKHVGMAECSIRHDASTIISRGIVRCEWFDTFGELTFRIDLKFEDALVERVQYLDEESKITDRFNKD